MKKTALVILFVGSLLFGTDSGKNFAIGSVSIKVYDSKHNKIVEKPTNIYGNDMDLFVAIEVVQSSQDTQTYHLTLKGLGKGRENDAEGLIEDYKVKSTKDVVLYGKGSKYIPFILKYPCTNKSLFSIVLINKKGNEVSKEIVNSLSGCYLN